MGFLRRLGLNIVTGVILMFGAGAALAQTDLARQTAETFIDEMVATSGSGDRNEMEAFLREWIDTDYVFNTSLAPVTGVTTQGQRERLATLMLRFTAGEAIFMSQYARRGELRFGSSTRTEAGTLVDFTYRDSDGERPVFLLMSTELVDGRLRVRDFGSATANAGGPVTGNSVVTKFTAHTVSLAQMTTDANVWITAFERAMAE